jgi:hypothetical protein
MRRLVRVGLGGASLLAALGCAAPFDAVKPSAEKGGVTLAYCGASATSTESVMKSLEPPTNVPAEVGGNNPISDQKELRVCVRLTNKGSQPVRIDRSNILLKCPHETDDWSGDRDDLEVIAHPGETREFHVGFRYSPLVHGEDVEVVFDRAVKIGNQPARLPPIVLRKR